MFNRCFNESCDLMRFVCQEYFSTIRHQNSKVLWVNVVFQILNILTASTGNLLVLVTIWRTPYLNRPSHTLLFSLALSDFCTGTIAQPIITHIEILVFTNTSTVSCILRTTCVFLILCLKCTKTDSLQHCQQYRLRLTLVHCNLIFCLKVLF